MLPIEKRSWEGLLNSDDADIYIKKNEYINAENFRFGTTDTGEVGNLETIGATAAKTNIYLPVGTNITIGACEDESRKYIVYFNYNSNSAHGIYCYDKARDLTYRVLLDVDVTGSLIFERDHLIVSRIVGGILYFTDNYNEPRKINIGAALGLYGVTVADFPATYSYTSPIKSWVLSDIRKPPMLPPTFAKVVGASIGVTVQSNQVKDFAGKFAWLYDYKDNERSVLSPWSKLVNYNVTADSFDCVTVTCPPGETIEQDVQKVTLVVMGSEGKVYEVRTWDKANASDESAIAFHNLGTGLKYQFLNDQQGVFLDNAYSVKPFDSVPLLAKALERAKNRKFYGNYLVGYNTPITSSLTIASAFNVVAAGGKMFKTDDSYQFAIVFYDFAGRKCGILTSNALRMITATRAYGDTSFINQANWTLSNTDAANEIPDWAYYYQIVRTRSLKKLFFTQCRTSGRYVVKNQDDTYTYTTTYDADAYAIGFNIGILNSYGMGYTFQAGDTATVMVDGTAAPYHLPVLGQDGNYVLVQNANLGTFGVTPKIELELYTPYKESLNEPFYEIGEVYKVTGATTGGRTYSTLSGTITGDIYLEDRGGLNPMSEVMSPNDRFWQEWNTDISKPNIVDTIGQKRKTHHIKFSNVLLSGSRVNGLSTFDALDEQSVPVENGPIQCLQLTAKVEDDGSVMLAISENETSSVYLGEAQLTQSTGDTAFIAQATGVIGQINTLKGSYGTIHPESVVSYRGNVYWYDANSGEWVEYSLNGLDSLSKYKLKRFSKLFSKKIKQLSIPQSYVAGDFAFQNVTFPNGQTHLTIVFTNAVTQQASSALLSPVWILFNYWNGIDHINLNAVVMHAGDTMVNNFDGNAIEEWRSSSPNSNFTFVAVVNPATYVPKVFGGIDPYHVEPMWSIPFVENNPKGTLSDYGSSYPYDLYDGQATTLVYKIVADRFMGKFTMTPEYFCNIGEDTYSFKSGILYIHNQPGELNLHGVTCSSRVMLIANADPTVPKSYQGLTVESDVKPAWVHLRTEYPSVQSSEINPEDFSTKEGIFYAPIKRDRLSPNCTGDYNLKRLKGQKMRATTMKILLKFTTAVKLKFIDLQYRISSGHRV